jgi:CRP/FNR family cyclic AMP-dependent transcriptional regulator
LARLHKWDVRRTRVSRAANLDYRSVIGWTAETPAVFYFFIALPGRADRRLMKNRRFDVLLDIETLLSTNGDGRKVVELRPTKIVFAQGDPADAVFYVQNGSIKLTVLSESGKEAALAILGPGDFFGQNCMMGEERCKFTAECLTDCIITRLEKAVVLDLIQQHPEFTTRLMSFLLQRTMRLQEDLIDQLFNSSEKRLARILLLLADFSEDNRKEAVLPRISQETLAEMVGTTRSRVSTFMNEFRRLGFVDYNGELRVRSSLFQVLLRN